jgi:hypothetical protein
VLLADANATSILDVTVPGGANWKKNAAGTRWKYTNPSGFQGITKVRVVAKKAAVGMLHFYVRGKNATATADTSALPIKGTFVVDSPIAMTGQCGETTPTCQVLAQGKTIRCK